MTNQTTENEARRRPVSIISAVWLIPLTALIIGLWLMVTAILQRGEEITLRVPNADGIQEGSTVIKLLNVEVGRITKIALNEQRDGVILTAKINADIQDLLRDDTQFRIVRPRIDRSGISGLSTLVSGVYIDMVGGQSQKRQHDFVITDATTLSQYTNQEGIFIRLEGDADKLIPAGSPVLYHQIEVGEVESVRFQPETLKTEYRLFIAAPNHHLIGKNTKFWRDDGVRVGLERDSISIQTPSLSTLLTGAITFDNPKEGQGQAVTTQDVFTLHQQKNQIPSSVNEQAIYRVAFFQQNIRGLQAGAAVMYQGVEVGRVVASPYFTHQEKAHLFEHQHIPVLFYLDPHLFVDGQGHIDQESWKKSVSKALNQQLAVSVATSNLISGSLNLELSNKKGKIYFPHQQYGDYAVIGTMHGGLDEMQHSLNALLDKFNQLPLEKTLSELNQTLVEIKHLTASKEVHALPKDIQETLAELRTTLKGIGPDAPIYHNAQNTLNKLDNVLKTMDEQPNSLIFNKKMIDPIPKGYENSHGE